MDKNRFEDRPNLLRVVAELSKCKDPDRVLEVLNLALMRQELKSTTPPARADHSNVEFGPCFMKGADSTA